MRSKDKFAITAHKQQHRSDGALNLFICKFITSLKRQPARKSGIHPYPVVFRLLSSLFSLNKQESWLFLRALQELGLIRLIPAHGVRILAEVSEDGRSSRE